MFHLRNPGSRYRFPATGCRPWWAAESSDVRCRPVTKPRRWRICLGAALAFALLVAACSSEEPELRAGEPILIGSFDFGESELLGEIYRIALAENNYDVRHDARLGTREENITPALRSGEINLVPEYIGSALEITFGREPTSDSEATAAQLAELWGAEGFSVLAHTPAQDKYSLTVTGTTAVALGLSRVSDLSGKAEGLVLGGPVDCPERVRCLLGLEEVYGLTFAEFKRLDAGGPITVQALKSNEVQVGFLFSSDGTIGAEGLVVLDDDLGLGPAENIAPVVAGSIVDHYGQEFVDLLDDISKTITQHELISMNQQVKYDGLEAADVARSFLETKLLIES
jgi:osmoprotectant transport system substrate-binding protein